MPANYFKRLRDVRDEYDAASEALGVLARLWDSEALALSKPITSKDVRRARNNLEFTYFVRLHAEFESILKDDVRSHGGTIGKDPKVAELESHALRLRGKKRKTIDPNRQLFSSLAYIHQHRNHVAHGDAARAAVTLKETLAAFNTFLSRLTIP